MVGRTPWSAADAPVGLLRAETVASCWFFDPVNRWNLPLEFAYNTTTG